MPTGAATTIDRRTGRTKRAFLKSMMDNFDEFVNGFVTAGWLWICASLGYGVSLPVEQSRNPWHVVPVSLFIRDGAFIQLSMMRSLG